ncbi:MAG: EutN/CcmL family microcompartment protein [Oscillibacter sp.]|nr:EutN/CcmL family microcompartment protein [Oscillibacter sp.]MCI9375349.1 EutN/CcmL family microcompartment protein [Oscillibacter sp.]
MLICEVTGHVWATKKEPSLSGLKMMVVREMTPDYQPTDRTFVAADVVGAGIGEWVLTVSGSTARRAFGKDEVSADAAIVGIIDKLEM